MNLLETVAPTAFVEPVFEVVSSRSSTVASSFDQRHARTSRDAYHGILGSFAAPRNAERTRLCDAGAAVVPFPRSVNVPALSSTVLQLELLLGAHQRTPRSRANGSIDLGAVSALVLSDLGATVQVLKMAGRKRELAEDRPRSIEHCIANFSTETWFSAVAVQPFARDHSYAVAASLWEHSQIIAHYSRLVAASTSGVNPEEAYLCGLLHDLGKLPSSLGWDTGYANTADHAHMGPMLARNWCLPGFIIDALDSQSCTACDLADGYGQRRDRPRRSGQVSGFSAKASQQMQWTEILATAHQLAVTFDGRQPGLLQ